MGWIMLQVYFFMHTAYWSYLFQYLECYCNNIVFFNHALVIWTDKKVVAGQPNPTQPDPSPILNMTHYWPILPSLAKSGTKQWFLEVPTQYARHTSYTDRKVSTRNLLMLHQSMQKKQSQRLTLANLKLQRKRKNSLRIARSH